MTKIKTTPTFRASLYVKGENFDPAKMADIMNILPDISSRKGEVRTTTSGSRIESQGGLYVIRSGECSDISLTEALVKRIWVTQVKILSIADVTEAYIDLTIVAGNNDKTDLNFQFSKDFLSMMSDIQIPVRVSIF
jgi:hypothetical protein